MTKYTIDDSTVAKLLGSVKVPKNDGYRTYADEIIRQINEKGYLPIITSWERQSVIDPHYQGRSFDIGGFIKIQETPESVSETIIVNIENIDKIDKIMNDIDYSNIVQSIDPNSIFDIRIDTELAKNIEEVPQWAKHLIMSHHNHIHITFKRS